MITAMAIGDPATPTTIKIITAGNALIIRRPPFIFAVPLAICRPRRRFGGSRRRSCGPRNIMAGVSRVLLSMDAFD